MAKLVGLIGTGSGRVGNMVLAKRDGLTIARAYQPQVANPSTAAQVVVRQKLKLASQVAAAMGKLGVVVAAANGYKNRRSDLVRALFERASSATTSGGVPYAVISSLGAIIKNPTLPVTKLINVSIGAELVDGREVIMITALFATGATLPQSGVFFISASNTATDGEISTSGVLTAGTSQDGPIMTGYLETPLGFMSDAVFRGAVVFMDNMSTEEYGRYYNATLAYNGAPAADKNFALWNVLRTMSSASYSNVYEAIKE